MSTIKHYIKNALCSVYVWPFLFWGIFCTTQVSLHAQIDNTIQKGKNTIGLTPTMLFLNSGESFLFYQRSIYQNLNGGASVRFSLGTNQFFSSEAELNNQTSGDRNRQINLGIELERKRGKFSVYLGPEIGHQRFRFDGRGISIQRVRLFNNNTFSTSFGNPDFSRFRMNSFHVFLGLRYYPAPQFSMSIEAAGGIGFFSIAERPMPQSGLRRIWSGNVREISVNRFFALAYHF